MNLVPSNRSYNHYCACGKQLDTTLEAIGGVRMVPRCDVNREDWKAIDGWIEAVIQELNGLKLATVSERAAISGTKLVSGSLRYQDLFCNGMTMCSTECLGTIDADT